jgi:hypothetical protein
MSRSILVPTQAFDKVYKRLNRLATKAGVELSTVPGQTKVFRKSLHIKRNLSTGDVRQWTALDLTQVLACNRVTVGELPAANGYSFLGKITHTPGGNLLCLATASQGVSIPADWRTAKPTCDHCKTKRARNETFIIQSPDGEIRRIGRNCLADFLKTDPATMIAGSLFEDALLNLDSGDGEEYESMGVKWGTDTFHYLCCAISSVAINGFVKKGGPEGPEDSRPCTAFHAGWIADGSNVSTALKAAWIEAQPTDDHKALAVSILLWLEAQNGATNDYIHNLQVACGQIEATSHTKGLIASAPTAYARAMGQIAEKKARESVPDAGYLGTVKERLSMTGTILAVMVMESGAWGPSALVKFRTETGHECATFTTSQDAPTSSNVGEVWIIAGTVKKHEMYKGRHQTTLTRCTWTAPCSVVS